MNTTEINSLNGIDTTKLTFDDIRDMYGVFRSESTGYGRNKTYTTRSGVQTKIGNIRTDIWCLLAEQLIERAGEEDIQNRLVEFVNLMPFMQKSSKSDRKLKSLQLHISRIFDEPSWVAFIPFNESFRFEALEGVEMVEVITSCCRIQGRVTRTQIRDDFVCCPYCGRFALFQEIKE